MNLLQRGSSECTELKEKLQDLRIKINQSPKRWKFKKINLLKKN